MFAGSLPTPGMQPIHIIKAATGIGGVTSLGDEVFIVRWDNPRVEVFDANTMSPTRTIPVPGLGPHTYCGLAVCSHNMCLYAHSYTDLHVHRIELKDDKISKWPTESNSNCGLSVNSSHNVVVSGYGTRKLYEYTTHGQLLRTIALLSDIDRPNYAIQLPVSGCFYGITHHGSSNGYRVVSDDGKIVKSYGKLYGSGPGEMKSPRGIAINRRGFVFIADHDDNRIVVVNPEKLCSNVSCDDVSENDVSRVLPVSVDGGLQRPVCLFLDESRDRLYVGELLGNRLIVVDSVNDLIF